MGLVWTLFDSIGLFNYPFTNSTLSWLQFFLFVCLKMSLFCLHIVKSIFAGVELHVGRFLLSAA